MHVTGQPRREVLHGGRVVQKSGKLRENFLFFMGTGAGLKSRLQFKQALMGRSPWRLDPWTHTPLHDLPVDGPQPGGRNLPRPCRT